MSSLSQFGGGNRVPRALINAHNAAAASVVPNVSPLKVALTGAVTASTLTTVLSVTGSGVINFFGVSSVDVTSRTHRVKVTLDGVVVFDATSTAVTAVNQGVVAIGSSASNGYPALDQIPFNSSLLVEYASSLSETAKTNIIYQYRTN